MRKSDKKSPQRDRVFIDRSPQKDKFNLDLDCAIASAEEHGLTLCDVVEQLMLRAEQVALLAKERGQDLSSLNELLFGPQEEDAQL
jgi:hypothetical protein